MLLVKRKGLGSRAPQCSGGVGASFKGSIGVEVGRGQTNGCTNNIFKHEGHLVQDSLWLAHREGIIAAQAFGTQILLFSSLRHPWMTVITQSNKIPIARISHNNLAIITRKHTCAMHLPAVGSSQQALPKAGLISKSLLPRLQFNLRGAVASLATPWLASERLC